MSYFYMNGFSTTRNKPAKSKVVHEDENGEVIFVDKVEVQEITRLEKSHYSSKKYIKAKEVCDENGEVRVIKKKNRDANGDLRWAKKKRLGGTKSFFKKEREEEEKRLAAENRAEDEALYEAAMRQRNIERTGCIEKYIAVEAGI